MDAAQPNDPVGIEVLVVEDSPTQAARLQYLLEAHGYDVAVASNGHEAIERIARRRPGLVLTDIVMPEMDGHELCRRIRSDEALNNIPVVLVTSLSNPTDVIKGLESGADNFIVKPYEEDELLARIKHVLISHVSYDSGRAETAVEIVFGGSRYSITSSRLQVLNLLVSSFEAAVVKNLELERLREDLQLLNDTLAQKVHERTAALETEIAERERAEQALRQSELRYRTLVESFPSAIAVWVEGRIVCVNPAGVRLVGAQNQEELIGRRGLDFFHPDRREIAARQIEETIARQEVGRLVETKLLRLDGAEVDVEAMAIPAVYEGRPALNAVIRDITDRKKAEEALRESEEQRSRSQRLETVGRLAGGIAHDFNNLLTAIIGNTALLLASPGSGGDSKEALIEIREAADRATVLTRQLLAFSRRQPLEPRVINLNEVARAMTGLLKRLIGEDIGLVFEQAPALWPAEADPGQIEQVIMNMAVNARDAMPDGGRLTIETANVELDEEYAGSHLDAYPGPHVMLAVSDTGCGMDQATLAHIFEPFFTTKEPDKGTGLGLSTVYGIVKQSGGNIWVYSELGQGTTFKLYLPRAERPVDWSPEGRATPSEASKGGHETILLVEDEPAVRALAARVLKGHGYTVLDAASPKEAIAHFDEHPGDIHLVLSDVVLPGMSGRALTEILTQRPGDPPKILYMSGYTRNAIIHNARLDPGVAFLEKPFTPDTLACKVREVLDEPPEWRPPPSPPPPPEGAAR